MTEKLETTTATHYELTKETTELKQVEDKLRLLSSTVEQSTEGMAVADLEGNLLFANNAFDSEFAHVIL